MFAKPSKELKDLMDGKDWDAAMEMADSTCTTGYDNDGSTGLEIFKNGVALGASAERQQAKIYVFHNHNEHNAIFFIAKDEVELKTTIEEIDDESGGLGDDSED